MKLWQNLTPFLILVSLVSIQEKAQAALMFWINNDYANGSINGVGVTAQGLKLTFGTTNGPAQPINLGNNFFGIVSGVQKPNAFPPSILQPSVPLSGPHQILNDNTLNPSFQFNAALGEFVAPNQFVHAYGYGCTEGNAVTYTQQTFTDAISLPIGLGQFVLPGFGQVIGQGPSSCAFVQEVNAAATTDALLVRIASLNDDGTENTVSFAKFDETNQIILFNPGNALMKFSYQSQIVPISFDIRDANDGNTALLAAFSPSQTIGLQPGEQITVEPTSVPESSHPLALIILGVGSLSFNQLSKNRRSQK